MHVVNREAHVVIQLRTQTDTLVAQEKLVERTSKDFTAGI